MELYNNNHSVFYMKYHLILVVKYRRDVFTDEISERAKEIFDNIASKYNITIEQWNHDKDHIHLMFRAEPNSEISKYINAAKSVSSRLIKKEFPEIKTKLWKEKFWSSSFCLITVGNTTEDIITNYIKSQGQK